MVAKKDLLLCTMLTLGYASFIHGMNEEECKKLSIMAYNLERERDLEAHFRSGFILGGLKKAAAKVNANDTAGVSWYSLDIYQPDTPKRKPLYIIHPSIQKRLDQNQKELEKGLTCCQQWSFERDQSFSDYHSSNAQIVFSADHWMSDLAKLCYLSGDDLYQERKKIIIKMIFEVIDPNEIKYGFHHTPLTESLDYKDEDFALFLLRNGALPDAKIIERAENNQVFKKLFLFYKNQTK